MLVSILIPCFNAERWIGEAIESALAQTWSEKEVIVVDDGSTDGSLEVIKSFGARVRWETGPNQGGNVARNRLLKLARGQWLQYLDADDYLLPDKVANQVKVADSVSGTDVVYSPAQADFGSGPKIFPFSADDMWILLARWYAPQTGGYLWRRQALCDVQGWNPTQPCCQEHELVLRLLMQGKRFTYYSGSEAVYRVLGAQSVSTHNRLLVMLKRIEILGQAERFLRESQQMNERRLCAINQARFEIARIVWLRQRSAAIEIVKAVCESQPDFIPGQPVPAIYRLLYRVFGFRFSELIADSHRLLMHATWQRFGKLAERLTDDSHA
jgi:glycosyltransferase involved in cell wall biosynthesis